MSGSKRLSYRRERAEEIFRRFEELTSIFPRENLVELEEAAREAGRELAKSVPRAKELVTRIVDKKDYPVKYTFDIIKTNLPGKLSELSIVSPSQMFSLLIMSDGVKKLSRSYSELAELSPYSRSVDAYEEDGTFIVRIGEMDWLNNFLATLYVDRSVGSITFGNIWAKWEEKV